MTPITGTMGWTRGIALIAVAAGMLVAPTGVSAGGEWDHLLAPEPVCPGQSDTSTPRSARAQMMVCMHNYARAQSGVPGLVVARKLRISSLRKARDIRRCRKLSHSACGRQTFHWFQRTGFLRGSYGAGENLAFGSGSAGGVRQTMSAWLHSDAHRRVLLAPGFESVGISVVSGRLSGASAQIWVAHFGVRR